MARLTEIANQLAREYGKNINPMSMTLPEYGGAMQEARSTARKQVADAQRAARVAGLGTIVGVAGLAGYAAGEAQAVPIDPLTTLPNFQNFTGGLANPTSGPTYQPFTGADGDVNSATYFISSTGKIFTAEGNTITGTYDTPLSQISGIALRGYDSNSNPLLTVSAGTSLYEGHLAGGNFNIDNVIGLSGLTSDVTDVDFNTNFGSANSSHYFVTTLGDGVREVKNDGSTNALNGTSGIKSIDMVSFIPDIYTNPVQQWDGENFHNMTLSGVPIGSNQNVDLNSPGTFEGFAFYGGSNPGMVGVLQSGTLAYHPFDMQQHMQEGFVPEPATLLMLAAGATVALAGRKYSHSKEK